MGQRGVGGLHKIRVGYGDGPRRTANCSGWSWNYTLETIGDKKFVSAGGRLKGH